MKLSYLWFCVLAKPIISASNNKPTDLETSPNTENSNAGNEHSISKIRKTLKPVMTYDNFLVVFDEYIAHGMSRLDEFVTAMQCVIEAGVPLLLQPANDPSLTCSHILRDFDIILHCRRFKHSAWPICILIKDLLDPECSEIFKRSFNKHGHHIKISEEEGTPIPKAEDIPGYVFLNTNKKLKALEMKYHRELQSLEVSSIHLLLAQNNIMGLLKMHLLTTKRPLLFRHLEKLADHLVYHHAFFKFCVDEMADMDKFRNEILAIHSK